MGSRGISSVIVIILGATILISCVILIGHIKENTLQDRQKEQDVTLEVAKNELEIPDYITDRNEKYNKLEVDENYFEGKREDYNIVITSYTDTIQIGTTLTINWAYDNYIESYTDNAYFCLVGFDESHKIIDVKNKADSSCGYAYYGEHTPLSLGTTLIEKGSHKIKIPQDLTNMYEKEPKLYFIRMFSVDERVNAHQWEGGVGWADAGPIYLND